MTVADVLTKARDLYAEAPSHAPEGHTPDEGTRCVVYALCEAVERDGEYDAAERALLAAAGIDGRLARWNAEHTTAEVLAAFDRAIEATS